MTVSLSGDAGDELFSGYVRYGLTERLWGGLSMVPFGLRRTVSKIATMPSPAMYDRIAGPLLKMAPSKWRSNLVGEEGPQSRRDPDDAKRRRGVLAALLAMSQAPSK